MLPLRAERLTTLLRRWWLGIVIAAPAAVALMLAACGGDDGGGPTATTPGRNGDSPAIDACSLLTEEDLTGALGADPGEGEAQDFAPFHLCEWSVEGTNDLLFLEIASGTDEELEEYFELTTDAEEITDIGDRAQWDGRFGTLEVIDDGYDVIVTLAVDGVSEDETFARVRTLAETVLGRLP